MAPDASPKLAVKSALVDTVIPVLLPAVTGPSLSPISVTATLAEAATAAVAVVTTIAVDDGGACIIYDVYFAIPDGVVGRPNGSHDLPIFVTYFKSLLLSSTKRATREAELSLMWTHLAKLT